MPDWTKSMQQYFEYYAVDPNTWMDKRRLDNIISSTIVKDNESDTLESATFDINDSIDECYIRTYLVTIQNGVRERFPLGTHLIQTPTSSFNGMVTKRSVDAYSPLIELKEKKPPIGYYIEKNTKIIPTSYLLLRDTMRAPIVKTTDNQTLYFDFVADSNDTYFSFISDLISHAKFDFGLDELGRVLFLPRQDTASLRHIWTFDDGNSSILCQDVTIEHDLYGVPNVVEVIYSTDSYQYYAKVENNDENSPVSIQNRGRTILHRIVNPEFTGEPTQDMINDYAVDALKSLSTLEYSVTYSHGYCPVRPGDCVLLNYKKAGLDNIKAKIVRQSINCSAGCTVSEKAVFTAKLWG